MYLSWKTRDQEAQWRRDAIESTAEPILTGLEQAAGHRQDTACKAAQRWNRSCGSAWISRYVSATD